MNKLLLLLSVVLFTACGGGTSVEPVPLKDIQFVDAPVDGIDYVCGKREFRTQTKEIKGELKHGIASCRYEPVTFSLGSLVLGQIDNFKDGQVIYPQDLINVSKNVFDNEKVLKMAMFIQSLDDDDINRSINITEEIKRKISIKSLNDLTVDEVKSEIRKLNKIPLDMKDVKKHIIKNSGIPYIEDLTIHILDNKTVGSTIGTLNIINRKNISKIKILKGENSDDFSFNKSDGSIRIVKKLDYRRKYLYNFDIQAKSINDANGDSNVATVTIMVESATPSDMKGIPKPVIKQSVMYTNSESCTVNIEGRVGTNVYINSKELNETISATGKLQFSEKNFVKNGTTEFSITLGYDNGKRSEATLFTVIHDNVKPIIKTTSKLFVEENRRMIKDIKVEDKNKVSYSISGIDRTHFTISSIGGLSFKEAKDYENPSDSDKNNIYDISITVMDKTGNSSTKNFTITVTNILDLPASINPFVIDMLTDTAVGTTIGTILIDEKDSPITKLELTGDGADNFQLNNDGTLVLVKEIKEETTFVLTVNATNKFGTTSETITINVKDGSKLAKVQLGLLPGATVKIIRLNESINKEQLVYTEKTSSRGTFDTHSKELEDNTFYIFEVYNEMATQNKGVFRLIAKGKWIKDTNSTIRITSLSELQYDYVVKEIKKSSYSTNNIQKSLDESAKILLKKDINGDDIVNAQDIIVFNPLIQYNNLYRTLKNDNKYQKITNQILDNNMSYIKNLFSSSILHSFKNADSFKVVGSFAYIYADNYFYIYDITNQEKVGELFLQKTDSSSNVSIFLDLDNNHVFLSNLNSNLVIIDIQDLNIPQILTEFPIEKAQRIIGKYQNILFLTKGEKVNDTKALNIENIQNIKVVNIPNLPYFDAIDNFYGHIFSKGTCSNDNLLHILTYDLSQIELSNKVSLLANRTLYSEKCNEAGYFDTLGHFYLYYSDAEENIFNIYGIPPEIIFLYSTMNIDVDFIINQNNNTLYVGNNSNIFFIDISNIANPYIYKTIPFQYFTDNLEFQDDIFTTKNNVIDLKSYTLSSHYMTLLEMNNEDTVNPLDLTLFKKFSN